MTNHRRARLRFGIRFPSTIPKSACANQERPAARCSSSSIGSDSSWRTSINVTTAIGLDEVLAAVLKDRSALAVDIGPNCSSIQTRGLPPIVFLPGTDPVLLPHVPPTFPHRFPSIVREKRNASLRAALRFTPVRTTRPFCSASSCP